VHEDVPKHIMERHPDVTLCIDLMCINKLPFLATISRHIKFGTIEAAKSRHHKVLLPALKNAKRLCALRGFRVRHCHVDNQFEGMRHELLELGMQLNVVAEAEHVPEIERHVRTIKERTHCVCDTVPFKRMPARMTMEMAHTSVFWLNMFPASDGVSGDLSPRALIVGMKLDHDKHCRLEFGSHAQTQEEHDHSMQSRTTGAIGPCPAGNAQGGCYFLSLTSGRRLSRSRWTALPMPQDFIDRVHVLARRGNANRDLTFAWRDGSNIAHDEVDDDDCDDDSDCDPDDWEPDSESDDEFEEDDNRDDDHNTDAMAIEGVIGLESNDEPLDDEGPIDSEHNDELPDDEEPNDEPLNLTDGNPGMVARLPNIAETGEEEEEEENMDDRTTGVDVDIEEEEEEEEEEKEEDEEEEPNEETALDEQTAEQEMEGRSGPRSSSHNLRPRRRPSKEHRRAMQPQDNSHLHASLEHHAMTQHSIKKGSEVFGDAGEEAALSEMKQLHDMGVVEPKKANMLTREEKSKSLNSSMFLKQKRSGRIKGIQLNTMIA
jgi:hypothetical protein